MGEMPSWIRFDVSAWYRSRSVRRMPGMTRAVYLLCLIEQAATGSLPSDVSELALAVGIEFGEFTRHWEVFGHMFEDDGDGGLRNTRMYEEMRRSESWRNQLSQAGKRGVQARLEARLKPGSKPGLKPRTKPGSSQASSAASSKRERERERKKERELSTGVERKAKGLRYSEEEYMVQRRFLDWWCSTWSTEHDGQEFVLKRIDKLSALRILRKHGRQEVAVRAQRMIGHPFDGYRGIASPRMLEKHWNALAEEPEARNGANGLQEGQAPQGHWELAGEERALIDRILTHEGDLSAEERTELLRGSVPDQLREKWR